MRQIFFLLVAAHKRPTSVAIDVVGAFHTIAIHFETRWLRRGRSRGGGVSRRRRPAALAERRGREASVAQSEHLLRVPARQRRVRQMSPSVAHSVGQIASSAAAARRWPSNGLALLAAFTLALDSACLEMRCQGLLRCCGAAPIAALAHSILFTSSPANALSPLSSSLERDKPLLCHCIACCFGSRVSSRCPSAETTTH